MKTKILLNLMKEVQRAMALGTANPVPSTDQWYKICYDIKEMSHALDLMTEAADRLVQAPIGSARHREGLDMRTQALIIIEQLKGR